MPNQCNSPTIFKPKLRATDNGAFLRSQCLLVCIPNVSCKGLNSMHCCMGQCNFYNLSGDNTCITWCDRVRCLMTILDQSSFPCKVHFNIEYDVAWWFRITLWHRTPLRMNVHCCHDSWHFEVNGVLPQCIPIFQVNWSCMFDALWNFDTVFNL